MAHMLQSRVKILRNIISSLLLVWVISMHSYAQNPLQPGELIVVGLNSSNSEFQVVPLKDLVFGTSFSFNTSHSELVSIEISLKEDIAAGRPILISNNPSNQIEVSDEFILNTESDYLILHQSGLDLINPIFQVSWGSEQALTQRSDIHLAESPNHQYHLKNGASGTISMIRNMVTDLSKWKSSDSEFQPIRTSFRILDAPVVVFNQNITTISESDSIPLSVAVYDHDGSRLTVDVVLNQDFSTADTNDIRAFDKLTFNFTGLVGDAVYELAVQQFDDDFFEDRETVFFELQNLSKGNFGDFISQAVFIYDNEIPDLRISAFSTNGTISGSSFQIQNNERVFVDIDNWKIRNGDNLFQLIDIVDLSPYESRTIAFNDLMLLNITDEESILIENPSIQLINLDDFEVNSFTSTIIANDTDRGISIENHNETNFDFNSTENPTQSMQSQNENTELIVELPSKIRLSDRWTPLPMERVNDLNEYVFWNEQTASFELYSIENADTLENAILFSFNHDKSPDVLELVPSDEVNRNIIDLYDYEWAFSLTSSDIDGNGVINDSEGYNFIQYSRQDSLAVIDLKRLLSEEIGPGFINESLFLISENSAIRVLKDLDVLMPGDFILLKADSIFTKRDITLSGSINYGQAFVEEEEEPISNFKLWLTSEDQSSEISINLFDQEDEEPISLLQPYLDLNYDFDVSDRIDLGIYNSSNWYSKLNFSYQNVDIISFPIGFKSTISGEFSFQLNEWNMEGGWRLFIEDLDKGERDEIIPGVAYRFEYFGSNDDEVLNENPIPNLDQTEINRRFNVLLISPDYSEELVEKPELIQLSQNYPNPFNPTTTISFYIPESSEVKLSVFNIVGQPITVLEQGVLSAGEHNYEWDASAYPSGMYIYQLEVGTKILTQKMTLVK